MSGRQLTRRGTAVARELDLIQHSTGDRPNACPWWAFHEPDVVAVLRVHDFFGEGQAREAWGDDPPWWLVLGVGHYHRVLERVRAESYELARKDRERRGKGPRLPPGFESEVTIER